MYVKQRLLSGDVAGMILTLPFVLATRKLVLCYSHPTTVARLARIKRRVINNCIWGHQMVGIISFPDKTSSLE